MKNIKFVAIPTFFLSVFLFACGDGDEMPENSNQLGQECNPESYVPNCQGMNARNCIEIVYEHQTTHPVNDAVCSGDVYKIDGKKAACRVLTEQKWAGCYVDCNKVGDEIESNGKTYVCMDGGNFKYYLEKGAKK